VREEDEFIFENVPALDEDDEFVTLDDEGFDPDELPDDTDYEWEYGNPEP
jgi:hypothetical protein